MPVQTEHRFPLDWTPPAPESPWPTCAARRGRWPCTSCAPAPARSASSTPAPWPGWTYPPAASSRLVVVPGSPTHAARVRRILGDRVTVVSSAGAQAHLAAGLHRTLLLQHSGIMLVGAAGVVRYRLATACPPAASTARRCRPRSTGRNAPTILPPRAAKG